MPELANEAKRLPDMNRHLPAIGLLVMAFLGACTPAAGSTYQVGGLAVAGPVCPVERNPPDPSCAPRPVGGAVLVVSGPDGHEVARATTDSDGRWALALPPGAYVLTPEPVNGLLGVAPPIQFDVSAAGSSVSLDGTYDTGIR